MEKVNRKKNNMIRLPCSCCWSWDDEGRLRSGSRAGGRRLRRGRKGTGEKVAI